MDNPDPQIPDLRRGRTEAWYPVILVVMGVLFFADPLFGSKHFYFRDILYFHYPLHKIVIDSYARGELPLWNPFVYLGQPMLANPNYVALYPTNLLHLFLPFNHAFKLHFILQPLLGGLGAYFLQRRLGIAPPAALGGSVVYQLSGPVISFLNLYSIVQAVALMPWIAWAYLGALQDSGLRKTVPFAAILALLLITGEPLLIQCAAILLAGLSLLHWAEAKARRGAARRIVARSALGSLLGASLAAVQLLPSLELLPRSVRGAGYGFTDAAEFSMHPLDLLNTAVPFLFGTLESLNNARYWGEAYHLAGEPYLVSYFLGTGAALLALFSFSSPRRKLLCTMAALAAVSAVLALGRHTSVYGWLFESIPFFSSGRFPSKYILLGTLAASVLVSLGLESVFHPARRAPPQRRRAGVVPVVGLLTAVVFFGVSIYAGMAPAKAQDWIRSRVRREFRETKDFPAIVAQLGHSFLGSGVFMMASGALLLFSLFRGRPSVTGGGLVVVLAAELISSNIRLSPLMPDQDFNLVSDVNGFLQQQRPPEPYRVVSMLPLESVSAIQLRDAAGGSSAWLPSFYRRTGQPMFGVLNGIEYSIWRTVDSLNTIESHELWKACLKASPTDRLSLFQKLNSPLLLGLTEQADPRTRKIGAFDTGTDRDLKAYWLDGTISRAYFVSGVEVASSPESALERFVSADFPFGEKVLLEEPLPAERAVKAGTGTVKIAEYGPTRVQCEVTAATAGYVVLLDSFYPGWRGYVDGAETKVLRANYSFRAVEVPAGEHRVEFLYRPRSFEVGVGITLAGILSSTALALPRRRRQGSRPVV